ncbi:MAG: shikimate kinase [Candidatus Fermentibacteraceae bacterium]
MKRNIFFIAGPPFSGKSTIGVILARRLRIPFENLDDLIEKRAGMPVHEVFGSMGEEGFRQIESMCLREIAASTHTLVVALGGGTLLLPENLEMVVSTGVLVTLAPDTTELLARFELSRGRPLVPDPEALAGLLKARREHYAGLPGRIDTRGKTPEEVVAVIVESSGFLPKPR